jgi:hypothetical protein
MGARQQKEEKTYIYTFSTNLILIIIPILTYPKQKNVNLLIYIKANLAGWLAGWLDVFVCVLLGDGGLLLCSGGVLFLVRSGGNDIFDI